MINEGQILDNRYQIISEIGEGGIGKIYKAYHLSLQKFVVIKMIKENFVGSINTRAEVDILKNLHHTYLPQVYDFIQLGTRVYTVMDFIEGYSLKDYMDRGYVFEESTLKIWLLELLEVLEYLHSRKPVIIHSDIKPANIMITSDNHVCLIDFNVSIDDADATQIMGFSKKYAAPEQIKIATYYTNGWDYTDIKLSAASDLYSLGKTFLYMTQEGVNKGYTYTDVLYQVLYKAVEEDVNNRYKNASKMKNQLLHMKKLDIRYKRHNFMSWMIHVGYGIAIIVSALLIYYGYNENTKEMFRTAVADLEISAAAFNSEEMIDKGIDIVNNKRFTAIRKRNPAGFAFVNAVIGDGYYEAENFDEAATFYELSVRDMSEDFGTYEGLTLEKCYTDYAITLAKSGDTEKAKKVLKEARGIGITNENFELIQGEIAVEQGNKEEAIKSFEVASKSKDKDISTRAYVLLSDIFAKTDIKTSIVYLKEAKEIDGEKALILRRLGGLYAGMQNYQDASNCYDILCKKEYATYEDKLNLCICLGNNKQYKDAIDKLKSLIRDKGDEASAYAYLARFELDDGNFEEAIKAYNKAKVYSRNENEYGEKEILEGLKEELE